MLQIRQSTNEFHFCYKLLQRDRLFLDIRSLDGWKRFLETWALLMKTSLTTNVSEQSANVFDKTHHNFHIGLYSPSKNKNNWVYVDGSAYDFNNWHSGSIKFVYFPSTIMIDQEPFFSSNLTLCWQYFPFRRAYRNSLVRCIPRRWREMDNSFQFCIDSIRMQCCFQQHFAS